MATEMETTNINTDSFLPPTALKKTKKRSANDETEMQIDDETGIEGAKIQSSSAPKAKRTKNSEVRKLAVPPHRLVFVC